VKPRLNVPKAKAAALAILLITAAVAAAPMRAYASVISTSGPVTVVPLDWRDTGYDLVPGYTYTVSLHDEYIRVPGGGHIAQSAIQAGPLEVKTVYEAPVGHIKEKLVVYINGEEEWESAWDERGYGSGSFDWAVQVACDCNGVCVVTYEGENVASFSITGPVDIIKYEEHDTSILGDLHSRARVTTSSGSGCQTTGNPSGTPPPGPSHDMHFLDTLSGAATTAMSIVLLGFGVILLLIVLGKAGGAKRLAKRALG
jgi:hypothetical protein